MEKRVFTLIICCFLFIGFMGCDSMTTTVQKAKDLQKNGRYADSIVMLETETAKRPNNREAHYLLGLAYLNTGRLESAHSIFSVALATQDNPEQKAFLKKELAKAYRDTFYRYLANVDPAERQKARLLLSAVPLYNSDPEFMNKIKERLLRSGSQYLNQYTLPRADEHFAYLYSLDKGSGSSIAEAYLNALTAGAEEDQEFNTVLVNRAIAFSKDPKIQKIFSEHYFGLSQKTESTEKALEYLKIANQHGGLYNTEFIEKKEQYELEKMLDLVKKKEKKLGKAKVVSVKDKNQISTDTINNKVKITYYSRHDFNIHTTGGINSKWPAAYDKEKSGTITCDKERVLSFSSFKKATNIYYWVETI